MIHLKLKNNLLVILLPLVAGCTTFERAPFETGVGDLKTPNALFSNQDSDEFFNSSGPHSFDWPLDQFRLTRVFRPRGKRPHKGIDLAAPSGTPIRAAQGGKVLYVGQHFRGYGRLIIIEHPYEWATFYSHLLRAQVKQGARVHQGELIGYVGRSGRATGNHLHFELRKDLRPLDPLKYLPFNHIASQH